MDDRLPPNAMVMDAVNLEPVFYRAIACRQGKDQPNAGASTGAS
jgi:hypothetical protein